MRSFQIHPLFAVIALSLMLLGIISLFIWLPIVCLNWVWNNWVSAITTLPAIGLWQAALLYSALICIIYLSDLVHIEFKALGPD